MDRTYFREIICIHYSIKFSNYNTERKIKIYCHLITCGNKMPQFQSYPTMSSMLYYSWLNMTIIVVASRGDDGSSTSFTIKLVAIFLQPRLSQE